ncbi:MAG: RHS repeat protein, partial [Rhodococcus sp. (in: high G+C Gram-positive bacteria)]
NEAVRKYIDYDEWGRVRIAKTMGDATEAVTWFDAAGRRIRIRDARGNMTFFYYDAQGRQVYAILRDPAAGGEVTETIYSSFNEVQVTVTHAKRLSTTDSATLVGGKADAMLIAKVGLLSDASVDSRTTVSYNRRGLIQQAIDALGYKTDTQYNAFGQLRQEIRDIDSLGTAGARRLTLSYGYDRRGNATRTERSGPGLASSVITGSNFDALGRIVNTTDELSRATQYIHLRDGGNGRKVIVTGPAGTAWTAYDALDRVLTRVDRTSNTVTYTHDAANRKLTVKTAEGIQTVMEYTRLGQVYRITDGNGAITTYAYDNHGNLLTVTDALGNVTKNDYDANDNLVQVIRGLKVNASGAPINDGATTTTSYSFDAGNRVLTQTVDPLVNGVGLNLQTRYEYDGQGRKLKITDPRGTVTTQVFNAKGELSDVIVDDVTGGLKLKTSYRYDAQSRVLTVIDGAGTASARKVAHAYDILGRRTSETVDPDGLKLKKVFIEGESPEATAAIQRAVQVYADQPMTAIDLDAVRA